MADYQLNFNQNQEEGINENQGQGLVRSSSDSVPREKSVSSSDHYGRNNDDGGDAAAGGGGGGGTAKSGFTITKIIALVAAIFTLVALGLSIYCTLLWWDWPWVLTAPALALVIVALVFAFVIKGHDEAVLVCAAIGIILALAAIIWCAVELVWCNSYQGELVDGEKYILKTIGKDKKVKGRIYHDNGHLCKGRCYDWSYRKEALKMAGDCRRKQEKWFSDKYLTKSTSKYSSCSSKGGYNGVDSYRDSPIWQTHEDIVVANKKEFSSETKKSYQESMDNFCKDFDVSEFTKKRDKCDKKIKKDFEPKCFENKGKGSILFGKGKKAKKLKEKDGCKSELGEDGTATKIHAWEYSKYAIAMAMGRSGLPDLEVPKWPTMIEIGDKHFLANDMNKKEHDDDKNFPGFCTKSTKSVNNVNGNVNVNVNGIITG